MPALHAASTLLALSDVDLKRADDRSDGRQVFLILRRDGCFHHRSRTGRTHGRQGRVVGLVDVRGDGTVCRPAIRRPRFATRAPRLRRGPILGKRRRLSAAGAPRGLERLAQSFVVAPQPFVLSPQRLALALCAFCAFAKRVDLIALRR